MARKIKKKATEQSGKAPVVILSVTIGIVAAMLILLLILALTDNKDGQKNENSSTSAEQSDTAFTEDSLDELSYTEDSNIESSPEASLITEEVSDPYYDSVKLEQSKDYYADIKIKDVGTVIVKLDPVAAPLTCKNFIYLARSGFYDGLTFHRIMEGFMMQGGDPQADGYGGSEHSIFGEFSANGFDNPLSHTRGAISMARSNDTNSASSQFFIVQTDNSTDSLDGMYACFGYVTEGMEIVDKICSEAEPTDNNGSIARDQQPVIESIKIREVDAA